MKLLVIGLIAGVFSALFGVGGGLVIVPLLVLWLKHPLRGATATSLGAVGIIASFGVIAYAVHGQVKPGAAMLLGLPAAVGAYYGVSLQQRVNTRTLSILFALLLLAIAGRLFV